MSKGRTYSSFTVLLVTAALSLLGLLSIRGLNLRYTPEPKTLSLQVQISWPDASPTVVESEVVSRIEASLASMKSCRSISSVSSRSRGSITMELAKGTDLQTARFEASTRIANLWPSLPSGVRYPYLTAGGADGGGGQMVYRLRSPLPSSRIAAFATDHIVYPLSSLSGVERVGVSGVTPYEWVITFDYPSAEALGITGNDIVSAISTASRNEIAGLLSENGHLHTIRLATSSTKDDGFDDIPIKNVGGRVVRLGEIATVRYQEIVPEYYFRLNGLNTVTLSVDIAPDANIITTAASVREEMDRLGASFPEQMAADLSYDSSQYVSEELNKIILRTLLCLAILLVFSFLVNRSWKQMLILMLSLVAGLLMAMGIYRLVGLAIHIYTLAGITVSFGIMIDTSILMIDHWGRCHNRRAFPSILYAVLTTVAALLMVLLLPEKERLNLTDFLWVIIINLSVSLAVCYWVVPALMEVLSYGTQSRAVSVRRLRRKSRRLARYESFIRASVKRRWIAIVALVIAFGIPLFLIPQASKFKEGDKSFLASLSRWEPYASNRRVIDKVLGSTFGLFYRSLDRSNFYREPDRKVLFIQAGMPEGCTVDQLNEVMLAMENFLAKFNEIESFTTQIHNVRSGRIDVRFKKEWENTSFPATLKSQVTSAAISFGGANWAVSGIDDNYFNNNVRTDHKSDNIILTGYNFEQLYGYAEDLMTYLGRNQRVSEPEIRSGSGWESPSTEIYVNYDRKSLAALGISPQKYYSSLSSRLFSMPAQRKMTEGVMTSVKVRSSAAETFDLWHVQSVPIELDTTAVSLSQIGTIAKRRSEINIYRTDQSYTLQVCYNFIGSYQLASKVRKEAIQYMNEEILPVGYKAQQRGGWFDKARERYGWLILLIIAVIYTMLCIAFESFRKPIAVIIMIPVSFIGLFLIFGLTDFSFDQGGFAALVMLCGITVNAGIYLISEYGALGGGDKVHRYIRAFSRKLIPISLTLISTILGLLPFLSDGPAEVFWFDFAIGTISGLLFSVVAIAIYLPSLLLERRVYRYDIC